MITTDLVHLATEALSLFGRASSRRSSSGAVIAGPTRSSPRSMRSRRSVTKRRSGRLDAAGARYAGGGHVRGSRGARSPSKRPPRDEEHFRMRAASDAVADHTAVFVRRIIDARASSRPHDDSGFSCAPVTWSKLWGVTHPVEPGVLARGLERRVRASLAAGSTTLATGSDIGSSRIRPRSAEWSASSRHVQRVPETEIFNLDHYCHEGPLARNVADCALLENVIMARTRRCGVAPAELVIPERLEGIQGLRIALSTDLGCYKVDEDVVANTRAAAARIREAGATVEEVSLPWELADINRAANIHFGMIFGPSVQEIYDQHKDQLNSYTRRLVEDGAKISKADRQGLELEGGILCATGGCSTDTTP